MSSLWQTAKDRAFEGHLSALIFGSGFIAGATLFSVLNYQRRKRQKQRRKASQERSIHIVRHGESEGNVDLDSYRKYGDHRLPLTENGKVMAQRSGAFLAEEFEEKFNQGEDPWIEMWVSPFTRTRETAIGMLEGGLGRWVKKVSESPFLVEQDWGLLEGMNIKADEVYQRFPESMKRVRFQADVDGKFYARLPQGESVADVYARVTNFLGSVSRRKNKHIIVVTHGITGRALIMRILRHTPEWFESSVNLPNASIYRITKTLNTKGDLEWHGAFTYGGFGKSGIEDEVDISDLNYVNYACTLRSLNTAVRYEQYLQDAAMPRVYENVRIPQPECDTDGDDHESLRSTISLRSSPSLRSLPSLANSTTGAF